MALAGRGRVPRIGGEGVVGGAGGEETSSTRKKKEEVLNQARAVLRQSQQFRPSADNKNNNLSSKLAFQQQPIDDFWTPSGVVVDTSSHHQQHYPYEGRAKQSRFQRDDDFGLPFRDAMKKGPISNANAKAHLQKVIPNATNASSASSSSTTISMNETRTEDLKVSSDSDSESDSESSEGKSTASIMKKQLFKPPQKEIKPQKLNLEQPTVKLTPLANPSSVPIAQTDKSEPELVVVSAPATDVEGNEIEGSKATRKTSTDKKAAGEPNAVGMVEEDEAGFSRAVIKKSDADPHWFEKALLVRGESISEAAYKAFKQVQAVQESDGASAADAPASRSRKKKPIFSNLTDPEYTADWISDPGLEETNSSHQEHVPEIPQSEYVDLDEDDGPNPSEATYLDGEGEPDGGGDEQDVPEMIDFAYDDDEPNTMSAIKTASELEASGVLDEISQNLHSVLDITEEGVYEDQDVAGLNAEEKSDSKEFDDAIEDESEPLKSIFNDIFQNPDGTAAPAAPEPKKSTMKLKAPSKEKQVATPTKTLSQSRSHRSASNSSQSWIQYQGEEEYDNTFIQVSSSTSTNKTASTSKKISSTKSLLPTKEHVGVQTIKVKKGGSSGILNNNMPPSPKAKIKKEKVAHHHLSQSENKTVLERRRSLGSPVHSTGLSLKSKSSGTGSVEERKPSKDSSDTVSSAPNKRQSSTGERLPHPSSRYQKNIQSILEKEVYQKELKRRRSQKLREEREEARLKAIAKESIERNKRTSWKDPEIEILLPELFKYKSVSGLQAAKLKRAGGTPGTPPTNYGAPYFKFDGAVSSSDQLGSAGMLAAAQVESLDIPDLVREVLQSNERMYKMTIEAGKQMAKAYKDKVKMRTATTRNN